MLIALYQESLFRRIAAFNIYSLLMKKEFEGIKYSLIMEISMMMKSNLLLVILDKAISKINRLF